MILRRAKKPVGEPAMMRLPDLLQEARAAGHPVELREDGDCGHVAPEVNRAALQIVDGALANARLFARGGPVTIVVRYDAEAIELSVANARGAAWTGRGTAHGLQGMRECARLCGGTLEARPDGRGGFIVHARLPRDYTPA